MFFSQAPDTPPQIQGWYYTTLGGQSVEALLGEQFHVASVEEIHWWLCDTLHFIQLTWNRLGIQLVTSTSRSFLPGHATLFAQRYFWWYLEATEIVVAVRAIQIFPVDGWVIPVVRSKWNESIEPQRRDRFRAPEVVSVKKEKRWGQKRLLWRSEVCFDDLGDVFPQQKKTLDALEIGFNFQFWTHIFFRWVGEVQPPKKVFTHPNSDVFVARVARLACMPWALPMPLRCPKPQGFSTVQKIGSGHSPLGSESLSQMANLYSKLLGIPHI